jgi:acyl-CoA thioester hydrolase
MQSDPRVRYTVTIQVEEADIDELGHVNNVVYLRWVQDAATAHWRAVASAQSQSQIAWVVLRHEIDYLAPAQRGDEIAVRTWVGQVSGITFERHTEILRIPEARVLACARTLWCPISTETRRPQRISRELRDQFSIPSPSR